MENLYLSNQSNLETLISVLSKGQIYDIIRHIFHNRCVLCDREYACYHEIIPRSLKPKTWFTIDNIVILCAKCHEKVHRLGSRHFREQLQDANNSARQIFRVIQRFDIYYLVQDGEDSSILIDSSYTC